MTSLANGISLLDALKSHFLTFFSLHILVRPCSKFGTCSTRWTRYFRHVKLRNFFLYILHFKCKKVLNHIWGEYMTKWWFVIFFFVSFVLGTFMYARQNKTSTLSSFCIKKKIQKTLSRKCLSSCMKHHLSLFLMFLILFYIKINIFSRVGWSHHFLWIYVRVMNSLFFLYKIVKFFKCFVMNNSMQIYANLQL